MAAERRINIVVCPNGCCSLQTEPYISNPHEMPFGRRNRNKAGIFIYDPLSNKILVVQSRGRLWGIPKGTAEQDEDSQNCAIREVYEETGIQVLPFMLEDQVRIKGRIVYFYAQMDETEVTIQHSIENNDANGIGWIKPECLLKAINDESMAVNSHCLILIKRFLRINTDEPVMKPESSSIGERQINQTFYYDDADDDELDDRWMNYDNGTKHWYRSNHKGR